MPDAAPKGSTPAPIDRMPTQPRVAAILLGVLAALLLINAVVTLTQLEAILDSLAEGARERDDEFDRGTVRSQLRFSLGDSVVVGLVAALSAFLLVRRRSPGRWLGIACALIQLILTLLVVVGLGGIPIYSLLLIVITGGALVMLFRRQTIDWLRTERPA